MNGQLAKAVWPVSIETESVAMEGDLFVPDKARGIVLVPQVGGSGRGSPRNRKVASTMWESGLATLFVDLLSDEEIEHTGRAHDADLLAGRLLAVVRWVEFNPRLCRLPIGVLGAHAGAAAALAAAAQNPEIRAVVARGGIPNLAEHWLDRVRCPTQLIVGGRDPAFIDLNRQALDRLPCVKRFAVIAGATHLFAEPGMLEIMAQLAGEWFVQHLNAKFPDRPGLPKIDVMPRELAHEAVAG